MPYASLRDFMDRLETSGRLVRVAHPVSPVLEMTEIQTRLLADGGPAVLFENVVGVDGRAFGMPVLVNLFGTVERVAWGWGASRANCGRWASSSPSCVSPSRRAAGARRSPCCRF